MKKNSESVVKTRNQFLRHILTYIEQHEKLESVIVKIRNLGYLGHSKIYLEHSKIAIH